MAPGGAGAGAGSAVRAQAAWCQVARGVHQQEAGELPVSNGRTRSVSAVETARGESWFVNQISVFPRILRGLIEQSFRPDLLSTYHRVDADHDLRDGRARWLCHALAAAGHRWRRRDGGDDHLGLQLRQTFRRRTLSLPAFAPAQWLCCNGCGPRRPLSCGQRIRDTQPREQDCGTGSWGGWPRSVRQPEARPGVRGTEGHEPVP